MDEYYHDIVNIGSTLINADTRVSYLHLDNKLGEYSVLRSYTEKRIDKSNPQGVKLMSISSGDNENGISKILSTIDAAFDYKRNNENGEFLIDYEALKYENVISNLRKWYDKGYIKKLKIVGNYTLNQEMYNKINYFNTIAVYASTVQGRYSQIIENSKEFYKDYDINSDGEYETDYFITEDLSSERLIELIWKVNNQRGIKQINIRFYNPELTVDIVQRLLANGLNKDVKINILGYPLTENSATFEGLVGISKDRNISVSYSCCHDLLGLYCHEPFAVDNYYFSELEPDGRTSIQQYIDILKFVEKFQRDVANVDSNIEKIMLAYQYLRDNYEYDFNSDSKKYGSTRDVDKILTKDGKKKLIVCAGYANLLTIMCRRVNIPMFTYGEKGHRMNIARVIDKDKDGNPFDKICTFDATNDPKEDSYTFFGLDPARSLYSTDSTFLTLANSLSVDLESLINHLYDSHGPFGFGYNSDYNSLSYRYAMLRLMGYNFEVENGAFAGPKLYSEGKIGEIEPERIRQVADEIARKRGIKDSSIDVMNWNIDASISNRDLYYSEVSPCILLNFSSDPNARVGVMDNYENMPYLYNNVDIDLNSITGKPIYYEELSDLPNGNSREKVSPVNVEVTESVPSNSTEKPTKDDSKPVTKKVNPPVSEPTNTSSKVSNDSDKKVGVFVKGNVISVHGEVPIEEVIACCKKNKLKNYTLVINFGEILPAYLLRIVQFLDIKKMPPKKLEANCEECTPYNKMLFSDESYCSYLDQLLLSYIKKIEVVGVDGSYSSFKEYNDSLYGIVKKRR